MSGQCMIDRMMASSELMLLKVCSPSALYRRCVCVCMCEHVYYMCLLILVSVYTVGANVLCLWPFICGSCEAVYILFLLRAPMTYSSVGGAGSGWSCDGKEVVDSCL